MANWIGKVRHTRTDTRANMHVNLFKLSFGRFLYCLLKLKSGLMTILKDLHAYLLLYQSFNPIFHKLISVPVLTNALGCNLISAFGLTDPLGRRLISALILTNHSKCHLILLILLCLATPFLTAPAVYA